MLLHEYARFLRCTAEGLCKLVRSGLTDTQVGKTSAPLWLIGGLAAVTLTNLLTVAGTLVVEASAISALRIPFPLVARLALAGLWALAVSALMAGLARRREWAFRQSAPLLTVYGASQWLWQALFTRADFDRGRLPYLLLISVLLLIPVWWLTLRRGWLRRTIGDG